MYYRRLYHACILFCNILSINKYPIKGRERYRPFFIVGSGRSGNTLLRRILNDHSEIIIPPETYVLGAAISRFKRYRAMSWPDLVEYVLAAFEFYPEFETFGISLRPLVQKLKGTKKEKRNLALILNSFYMYYAEQTGKACRRWGDKTPLNTFALEAIYSVFPDARFIHIIRDGCDVVASYVKAGIYQSVEEAAKRWIRSIKTVNSFQVKYPDAVLNIRYEQLVTEPQQTLRTVCQFIGIDFQPQMLNEKNKNRAKLGDVEMRAHHSNVLKPISTSNIGRGRATLSVAQKEAIQLIIGEQLRILGYDDCRS